MKIIFHRSWNIDLSAELSLLPAGLVIEPQVLFRMLSLWENIYRNNIVKRLVYMMDFFLWVLLQQYIVYLLALKHPSFGLVSWFLWFGFLSCFFWFGLNIERVEIHVSLKRTSIRDWSFIEGPRVAHSIYAKAAPMLSTARKSLLTVWWCCVWFSLLADRAHSYWVYCWPAPPDPFLQAALKPLLSLEFVPSITPSWV